MVEARRNDSWRREESRWRTYRHATLEDESGRVVLCTVIDCSQSGVQVNLSNIEDTAELLSTDGDKATLKVGNLRIEVQRKGRVRFPQRIFYKGVNLGLQFPSLRTETELKTELWNTSNSYSLRPVQVVRVAQDKQDELIETLSAMFGVSIPFVNIAARLAAAGCNLVRVEWNFDQDKIGRMYDGYVHRRYRSAENPARLHFYRVAKGDAPYQYFGYTVIRPSNLRDRSNSGSGTDRLGHIGKTVITYPEGTDGELIGTVQGTEKTYFLLGADYRAIALGLDHNLTTVAYQQQTRVTGTCGHTAVACASSYLHRLQRLQQIDEEAIKLALAFQGGRSRIVDNLPDDSIADALALTGCNVRCYNAGDWTGSRGYSSLRQVSSSMLAEVAHFAIDSLLPPVIIFRASNRRHAILGVGHTARQGGAARALPSKENLCLTTTAWVDEFLVHDDAKGPFLQMPLRREDIYAPREPDKEKAWQGPLMPNVSFDQNAGVVMVPLPGPVAVDPVDVLRISSELLTELCVNLSVHVGEDEEVPYFKKIKDLVSGKKIVCGTYLDHGDRLRLRILSELDGVDPGSDEARVLSRAHLPSHVFAVNLLDSDAVRDQGPFKSMALGYLILDATAVPDAQDIVLLGRLGELFFFRCPTSGMRHTVSMPFKERRPTGVVNYPS